MRVRTGVVAAAIMCLTATGAVASEKAGVSMPDKVNVANETLVLNGMGVRKATMLNVKVYVAGLYLTEPSTNAQEILASDDVKMIQLAFVRDVDRKDIVEAWDEGFAKSAGKNAAALRPRIDALNGYMSEFKTGDTLAFVQVPGKGVEVKINGKTKGMVQGDDFSRALFGIWLGPKPPNKELRAGMLRGPTGTAPT